MSKTPSSSSTELAQLEKAALAYLERFASSAENLRRVLRRRIARVERRDGVQWGDAGLVDKLVARFESAGLLDDAVYAEARARTLHRRGVALYAIQRALAAKGVAASDIEKALDTLREEVGNSRDEFDRQAALALARRRRLGPFRPKTARAECRERDMAILGRAGFSYEIARSVVDGDPDGA